MTLYRKIFLADDDPDDRETFMDALREIDNTIHCFQTTDGERAIEVLTGDTLDKPELIFLDTNMPKVKGNEVLKWIKDTPEISNIPVIMHSTFFSAKDIKEFTELGASHYLLKPTSFRDLCNALKNILTTVW